MNIILKLILILSIYILTFSIIYYLLDHKYFKKSFWSRTWFTKDDIDDMKFKKKGDKYVYINKQKENKKDIPHRSFGNFLDYVLFTLFTQTTVGYSSILSNRPIIIILNCIQLYITIFFIPMILYFIKGTLPYKYIFYQTIAIIIFTVLYKIANYIDIKYKTNYNNFQFSKGSLKYLYFIKNKDTIQLKSDKKLWYQWVRYSWNNCLYWSMITQSLVGYGNTWYPVTRNEKIVNTLQQIVIIILIIYYTYNAK
tara:strand:- start:264 stop:1022 length:759 start_codon:yes stop_codon:yes gene_type:complete